MSTGSFTLSKKGDTWFADGELESGRKISIDLGKGSRDRAEGLAEEKWKRKLSASHASKKRWEKFAARSSTSSAPPSPPNGSAPPPPTPSPSPSASTGDRAAEIRGKLLSLGDAKPIDDDQADDDDDQGDDDEPEKGDYIPPGAKPDDDEQRDDDDAGEDDEEAEEFLAEMLGNGAVTVVTGTVTKVLKRRKPPMTPGEPHEKFVDYARQGFTHRARKLIGKNAKLGPNGKLFVGVGGIIAMMLWNAEEVAPEQRADAPARPAAPPPPPPPARPAAAPAPPPAHANGTTNGKTAPPSHLALIKPSTDEDSAPDDDPLGRFS